MVQCTILVRDIRRKKAKPRGVELAQGLQKTVLKEGLSSSFSLRVPGPPQTVRGPAPFYGEVQRPKDQIEFSESGRPKPKRARLPDRALKPRGPRAVRPSGREGCRPKDRRLPFGKEDRNPRQAEPTLFPKVDSAFYFVAGSGPHAGHPVPTFSLSSPFPDGPM